MREYLFLDWVYTLNTMVKDGVVEEQAEQKTTQGRKWGKILPSYYQDGSLVIAKRQHLHRSHYIIGIWFIPDFYTWFILSDIT